MTTERSSQPDRMFRFGSFELSEREGELRKNGVRIKLQEHPLRVLLELLSNSGRLVTREELQQKLWPADTFVDFDVGVNTAIRKLRQALGDEADNPRFIETLARRGYRFVAPVEAVQNGTGVAEDVGKVGTDTEADSKKPIAKPEPSPTPLPKPRRWKYAVLILVALASFAGLLYLLAARKIAQLIRLHQLQQLTVLPLTALPGNVTSPTFSPDGSQVAFAWDGENGGNGYDLYVKVIGTEKPLRLTNQPGSYHAAWSPDGKSIAIERIAFLNIADSGVYLVSPLSGAERKITERCVFGFTAVGVIAWSPDGKQLACVGGATVPNDETSLLFTVSMDTLQLTPIKTDCKRVISPAFSPHGDYLAWTCADIIGGSSVLELQRLSDGHVTQLSHSTETIGGPVWSRDGHRLLFTSSYQAGDIWEFLLASPDNSEKLPVGHDAFDLAVSPVGNRLAFAQSRINVNIWRLDLGELHPHAQIAVSSSREQNSPDISPNGDQIAFNSTRSGSNEVWVSGTDGSSAVQLSSFGIYMTGSPRWSPDGKLIAFDSRVGGESNIYLVDPRGGVPRKLDIDIHGNNTPSWSRDGKWIYFVNGEDAHHSTGWKVPSTGGHAVSISDGEVRTPIESPDGQCVYFFRQGRLWSVMTDGTVAELVEGMPYVFLGGWTPVRTGIYFISLGNGRPGISFFNLATKETQLLYVWDKRPPGWVGAIPVSPDGKWLLFPQLDEQSSDLMMIENWN